MGNQRAGTGSNNSRTNRLYKISAGAALTACILLLVGLKSLIISFLHLGIFTNWFAAFPDNWLIVIFKLLAGFSGVHYSLLNGLDFLDIVLLALAGIMLLGLYAALKRINRFWSIVAALQPFLGLVLFIITKNTGRSALMGAALVISFVMLKSTAFAKSIALTGIAASLFLLIGDFSAGSSPSMVIATLFGLAYVFFTAWLFAVALTLFRLDPSRT